MGIQYKGETFTESERAVIKWLLTDWQPEDITAGKVAVNQKGFIPDKAFLKGCNRLSKKGILFVDKEEEELFINYDVTKILFAYNGVVLPEEMRTPTGELIKVKLSIDTTVRITYSS